jgi:hypothetical protein
LDTGKVSASKTQFIKPEQAMGENNGVFGGIYPRYQMFRDLLGATYHIYLGSLSIHRGSLCHGPLGAAQDWVWVCMGMDDTICCFGIHMMNMLPMAA